MQPRISIQTDRFSALDAVRHAESTGGIELVRVELVRQIRTLFSRLARLPRFHRWRYRFMLRVLEAIRLGFVGQVKLGDPIVVDGGICGGKMAPQVFGVNSVFSQPQFQ